MYRERRVPHAGGVLWRASRSGSALILPDGCIDVIVSDDTVTVAGPATRAFQTAGQATGDIVGLRFSPGYAPALLGVPASELRDENRLLRDVVSAPAATAIESRVLGSTATATSLTALFAARLAEADKSPLRRARLLTERVLDGSSVGSIAIETGYSERQLNRLSQASYGYGLRTLSRILRFQRAVARLDGTESLGAVAALSGYSDQAHFSRDSVEFAGLTPRQLRAQLARDPAPLAPADYQA